MHIAQIVRTFLVRSSILGQHSAWRHDFKVDSILCSLSDRQYFLFFVADDSLFSFFLCLSVNPVFKWKVCNTDLRCRNSNVSAMCTRKLKWKLNKLRFRKSLLHLETVVQTRDMRRRIHLAVDWSMKFLLPVLLCVGMICVMLEKTQTEFCSLQEVGYNNFKG